MKKITVIFSVLVLCCISVFAQDKMEKTAFDKLVDYANCQYLMAFIEKNDAESSYFKEIYTPKVKPVLQKATLDDLNKIPTFEEIKSLLENTNNKALKLASEINNRKNYYNECLDNDSLLVKLNARKWGNIDLSETATKIQNSILTKVGVQKQETVQEQETPKNQNTQTSSQGRKSSKKNETSQRQDNDTQNDLEVVKIQRTIFTLRILVIICLVLIIVLIAALFWGYKTQINVKNQKSLISKFVKDIVLTDDEIKKKFASKEDDEVKKKLNDLEYKIVTLQQYITKVSAVSKPENTKQEQKQTYSQSNYSTSNQPKEDGLYFGSKNKKTLINETSKENAKFRVFNIKGNEADFDYCGGVTNLDFFENVCDFEGNPYSIQNKTSIKNVRNGKVTKNSDGNWEVSSPAKIKVS